MKKFAPSLIGVCLAAGAFGQQAGYLGTKVGGSSPETAAQSSSVGPGAFIQMVLALGIVLLLLKLVLPKVAGKLNKRLTPSSSSLLSVEETASFAGGNLYIVKARQKTLLLSATSSGVTCLADLTEGSTEPAPTFEEIVQAAEPLKPEQMQTEEQAPADPIAAALQRIERLSK